MKKTLIVLSSLIGLAVAFVLALPFVVDVDRYRPQIVKIANENINGSFEMGKLSLSLWGQIRIQIEGISLSDSRGRKILNVAEAYFHLPFSSLVAGEPVLTLRLQQPAVSVVKDTSGKLNITQLMKEEAPAVPPPTTDSGASMVLPALVAKSRLGIDLHDANLNYRDEAQQLDTRVDRLNVSLKDLSLTRPIELEASADLDTTLGQTIAVKGPAKASAQATTRFAFGNLEELLLKFNCDLSAVSVSMPGLFEKKAGQTATLEGVLRNSSSLLKLEKFESKFVNLVVNTSGEIRRAPNDTSTLALEVKSNSFDLKPWSEMIPPLKAYELGGKAAFQAKVEGPTDKMAYRGTFQIQQMTAKSPMLKAEPKIDVQVQLLTDQIESFVATMKAPGNDLRIQGSLTSFLSPSVKVAVSSNEMDLDQLLVQAASAPAAPQEKTPTAPGAPKIAGSEIGPESNYDAMLDPLRKNPIAAAAVVNIVADLKKVKSHGVSMSDVSLRGGLVKLKASVDSFGMKLWGGTVSASGAAELFPAAPTYRFESKVTSLDLKQAVESQYAFFKNTLLGKADFQISGTGASFNPPAAKTALNAKGSMKITQAAFASFDITKMATEAVSKVIASVGEKVPPLKGKSLPPPSSRESKYRLIASDFVIRDGRFSAPNFSAQAEANQGIDLKGSTQVGLADLSLKAEWELVDTYNVLRAKDLPVEMGGVKVPAILVEPGQPFKLPVSVGCTVSAPCTAYERAPEYLLKVATGNLSRTGGRVAEDRAKAEIQKRLSPKANEAVKELGKKLFGR